CRLPLTFPVRCLRRRARHVNGEVFMESDTESLNVAVLRGTCSSPAAVRTLPSGDIVADLQLTARVGGRAVSVPVSVPAPAAWVEDLDAGDEIVVVGHVRRRFFRAAGATASRVEV